MHRAANQAAQAGDNTQWLFPPLDLTLYTDEADNYLLNVTAAEPRIFVMWRQDEEAEPPVRPMQLSASYGEAARWMLHCHHMPHLSTGMMTEFAVSA